MCEIKNYVSPYLRRPLRSFEEIVREEAERTGPENQSKARAETVAHEPGHEATDDAEPRE